MYVCSLLRGIMHNTFKALADETRCNILWEIIKRSQVDKEICACHIHANINCSQSTMSHHLKVLTDANILIKKKVGKYHHYYLNHEDYDLIFKFIDQYKEKNVCN